MSEDGRGELMAKLVEAQIVQRVWKGDEDAMRSIREAVSRAAVDRLVQSVADDYNFKQALVKEISALVMPIAREVAAQAVEQRRAEIANACSRAVSQAISQAIGRIG